MRRRRLFVGLTLLAIAILLNLPLPVSMRVKSGVRDQVAPFQNVLSLLVHRAHAALVYLRESGEHAQREREMAERTTWLEYEVRRLESLRHRNEELERLLAFKRSSDVSLVTATVVARNEVSGWWQTLRLDVGSLDGVGDNMAVITPEGLIGRTTSVSKHTCDVMLLIDPSSRVACRVTGEGEGQTFYGVLQGRGVSLTGRSDLEMLCAPRLSRLDYLPATARIESDAEVRTSGLGGIYPPDLRVGYVRAAYPDTSGLYLKADVEPAADLSSVRFVFVVAPSDPRISSAGGVSE